MSDPLTIPLSSIIEGNRARKDYGDLTGLKESLKRIGSIHPIVLSKRVDSLTNQIGSGHVSYVYDLIAGGRRFRAMKEMGITHLTHASVLNPDALGFSFKDEVPEDELREAELDENVYRLKPKWQEDAMLVADIHALKRAKHGTGKWGQRQTAALLGDGFSVASVNIALKVAKALVAKDAEVLACANMSDALATLIKRKEDVAFAEAKRRVFGAGQPEQTLGPVATPGVTAADFLTPFNIDTNGPVQYERPLPAAPTAIGAPSLQAGPVTSAPVVVVPLSTMFTLGDNLSTPWTPTHHIVTDIPYGIDMENLNQKNIADVASEHEVQANIDMMPLFLRKAYDAVLPHGFCVFFYDLDHHEKLQAWATEIGWRVQRWPFIAVKSSACQNNAAQYNLTKNFEVAMFLRKDEHSVLRHDSKHSLNNTSWKSYDFAAERRLYNNPFAKPFELWKDIYDMIAFPGQSVRDPYAGEMSACRAAANCGLMPYGNEISEQHFNRGIENMQKTYAHIHMSNVRFT